jgi:hypothetical protein
LRRTPTLWDFGFGYRWCWWCWGYNYFSSSFNDFLLDDFLLDEDGVRSDTLNSA